MDTSRILPNEDGPLFELKPGILERLKQTGQGDITLGQYSPSTPGPNKFTPEEPHVRGAEWGRYTSELNLVREENIDLEDKYSELKAISGLNVIDSPLTVDTDESEETTSNEEVEVEDEFSVGDEDTEETSSGTTTTSLDTKTPEQSDGGAEDTEEDTEETMSNEEVFDDDDGDSSEGVLEQFAASQQDDGVPDDHTDYDYPDEDEPEEPAEEQLGVEELPTKTEINRMKKDELKQTAEAIGVYDDVEGGGEGGHVRRKDLKRHLRGLVEEKENADG